MDAGCTGKLILTGAIAKAASLSTEEDGCLSTTLAPSGLKENGKVSLPFQQAIDGSATDAHDFGNACGFGFFDAFHLPLSAQIGVELGKYAQQYPKKPFLLLLTCLNGHEKRLREIKLYYLG